MFSLLSMEQPYSRYTAEQHQTWAILYARMLPLWTDFANPAFLEGLQTLRLAPDRIPRLSEVNQFLSPLTGFRATPVPGYVPAFVFFDCLRRREFPTTVTIRGRDQLDYLPEPDIFHDIAGHVPMHTDTAFASTLVRFGECARSAALRVAAIGDTHERLARLRSIYRALARFFWFTIEFGLMADRGGRCVAYGSGLLSSHGELRHAIESPDVQRSTLQLEWVIHQSFEIDHYQPLLFVVESFDHLYDEVGRLDQWLQDGRLDHVAPGDPQMSEADLESFLLDLGTPLPHLAGVGEVRR